MRKLITGLFVVGVSLGAAEAQAAQEAWKCVGASYVCGKAEAKAKVGAGVPEKDVTKKIRNDSKKVARKKTKKTYETVSASTSSRVMTGKASYYWQGQRVASGGRFNPNAMTAAHKTLPFGTQVRVTNRHNGRSVVVKINDRGPFVKGRIIDLSRAAAHEIGMQKAGVVPVSVEVLGKS